MSQQFHGEVSDELSPRAQESVPVMLVRMEGKIDLVSAKVTDLIPRVNRLEDRTKTLEDLTLSLSKDAEAEAAKKIALALALKEADENRRNQSEQTWTPVQRFMAVLASIGGAAALAIQWFSSTNGH